MHLTRFTIHPVLIWSVPFLALPVFAAPIANLDNYPAVEDTPLAVPVPGVLGNDLPNGISGGMSAVKVTDPLHGTLSLQPDGSFSYTPQSNYFGPDSFQYKAVETQGPIVFTVDQANSVLTVNVQSNIGATGVSDNETTTAQAKGTMTALITPVQAPFSTAQIRTVNLAIAERATVTLCVVEIIGCAGTLTARIEPDGLAITMRENQAGPAVPVSAGVFNQPGNRLDTTGTIFLSTGGLASGVEVPPSESLNSTDLAYDFRNAGITQSGGTLTLLTPLDISQTIVDPQYTATVRITGTIRATAPVPPAGSESPPAAVTLNITSVDDPPVAVADRYYTRQNYRISVPAAASQPATETLIPGNSAWKYATGTDLGTAWRDLDFADAAWASGNGVLGYGDADVVGNGIIPARANPGAPASATNPNYPTAYFRKEITLTAASSTVEARVEFQRDDACLIYVNGTEVYRDSTPFTAGGTPPFAATGEISYATYCAAGVTPDSDGAVYKSVAIDPALLREGKNVIAAEVHQTSNTSSDLRYDLKLIRSAQPTETLIGGNSTWKYATGVNLGTSWRSAEYDDSAWSGASGPLGYDNDILPASTIPARANPGMPASAANPNYPTAYFRREFTLTTPFDTVQPRVEFQRDDACLIYVNGVEIYRDSTPYATGGAAPFAATGEIAYTQYAAANIPEAESVAYKSVGFSRALLREGRNVIAAEVHQNTNTSSDLRFDLKCYRSTGVGGLASNDSDVDGPAMSLALHSTPANGTVSINPDGSFTYLPNPGFPGAASSATDSFAYRHTTGGLAGTLVEIVVLNDDLDADNVSDTWERSFGIDATVPNAGDDPDGDGQDHRAEFLAGTNPLSASSLLRASSFTTLSTGEVQLGFDSVPGRTYQLQRSGGFEAWLDTGGSIPAHASSPQTVIQFAMPPDARMFFRVRVVGDWQ
jgi:Bacterial Ig domain